MVLSNSRITWLQGVIAVYQLERAQDQGTSNSFVRTLLSHNFE